LAVAAVTHFSNYIKGHGCFEIEKQSIMYVTKVCSVEKWL